MPGGYRDLGWETVLGEPAWTAEVVLNRHEDPRLRAPAKRIERGETSRYESVAQGFHEEVDYIQEKGGR